MKNLLSLFALVFVMNAQAIVTSPMSNQFDAKGNLTRKDQVFIQVKNGSGSSLASGSVVVWDLTADDGATVTTTTTKGDESVACVAAEDVGTVANGSMFKCQVYGKHAGIRYNYLASGDEATAGASVYASGTASYATGIALGSRAHDDKRVGTFLDSASSTGSVEAFINLL